MLTDYYSTVDVNIKSYSFRLDTLYLVIFTSTSNYQTAYDRSPGVCTAFSSAFRFDLNLIKVLRHCWNKRVLADHTIIRDIMIYQLCKSPSVLVNHCSKHSRFIPFRHHVPAIPATRHSLSSSNRTRLLRVKADVDDASITLDVPETEDARGAIAVRAVSFSQGVRHGYLHVTTIADAERLAPLSGWAGAVQCRKLRDRLGYL